MLWRFDIMASGHFGALEQWLFVGLELRILVYL
jgi:hypothetical protein